MRTLSFGAVYLRRMPSRRFAISVSMYFGSEDHRASASLRVSSRADGLNRHQVAERHVPAGHLTDVPQFGSAHARADGTLERLASDRVGRAQRRSLDRARVDRPRLGEPAVLPRLPRFLRGQRVVRKLIVMAAGDAEIRALVRIPIEVRRQVGVCQRLHLRICRLVIRRHDLLLRTAATGDGAAARSAEPAHCPGTVPWPSYGDLPSAVPTRPETRRRRRRTDADSGPSGLP